MARKTNCIVNGKPMYRVRIRVGTSEKGKPIYRSFYGIGKSEAESRRDAYLQAQVKSPSADRNDSLLKVAEYYTYHILPNENLAAGTVELYERQYRNVVSKERFCVMPLSDLRTSDLQAFFNTLDAPQSVIQATAKFMRRLFRWMASEGYCSDLMSTVKVKGTSRSPLKADISVFSPEDVKQINNQQNRLRFLIFLAFATGMRLGELLALQYSDFRNGSVIVSKQLSEHYAIGADGRRYEATITETKSRSSNRTIPLPPSAEQELRRHRDWHRAEMVRNGYRTDFVFTSANGHLLSKSNFRRSWVRILKACGIPYRKFHACRATYCTMLCQQGVPLETASQLMGHADVSVTARYYRFVSDSEMREAVSKLDSILSPVGDNLAITK